MMGHTIRSVKTRVIETGMNQSIDDTKLNQELRSTIIKSILDEYTACFEVF